MPVTEPHFAPYAFPIPTTKDADHLRVLSILHYVWGGLVLLFSCLAIIYVVLGVLILTGRFTFPTSPGQPPPPSQVMGWMFAGLGGCGLTLGTAVGTLTIVSARRLAERRSRTFSIVMAAVSCLSVPLGTTLGLFTIVVLMRPSVKAMYAEAAGRTDGTPPPSVA